MNPYIILAVVLAIGSAGVGGAYFGYEYRDGKVAKEIVDAQRQAIVDHNEDAASDMVLAYERGQAEAKVRVITRTIIGESNAITASAPIPANCRLDAPRRMLLDKAIAAANNETIKETK